MRGLVLLNGLLAGLCCGCVAAQMLQNSSPAPAPSAPVQAPAGPNTPSAPEPGPAYQARTMDPDPPAPPNPPPVEQPGDPTIVTTPAPTPVDKPEPPSSTISYPRIITGAAALLPREPESCVLEALRALQEKRPEEEVRRCLASLDQPSQDLLLRLLPLSHRLGERGASPGLNPQDMGKILDQVDEVGAYLRTRAPLLLPTVCFCQRIETFGVYEPLASPEFQAGVPARADVPARPGERVQLYVEVRNFGSRKWGRHYYETGLACKLDIHESRLPSLVRSPQPGDAAGNTPEGDGAARPIESIYLSTRYERSLTPRQDYFIRIQFHISPKLTPGRYTLAVEVRDDIGIEPGTGKPRLARNSVDFQVVSPHVNTQN